jgi:hypothetical protein
MLFNICFNRFVHYALLFRRQFEQKLVKEYQLLRCVINYVYLSNDAKLFALRIYKLFFLLAN